MKFIQRLFADSAIQLRAGKACCLKGKLTKSLLHDLSLVARDAQLDQGEIWMDASGKVTFSREIPETLHQRIRNVIFMH